MLTLNERINAFCKLGDILTDACKSKPTHKEAIRLARLFDRLGIINPWFIPEYVRKSISAHAYNLNREKILKWLDTYKLPEINSSPNKIGVIMAGNIPMVGFHDFLCVLISGNSFYGKLSSKDSILMVEVSDILINIDSGFKKEIHFTEAELKNTDALIATGSDNSSRYFNYRYGDLPHIFRSNRNSVAIIDDETEQSDLKKLGADVFDYFGLGCRNVSKLFLPLGFDFARLKSAWEGYAVILDKLPYRNNYIYQKAILSTENKKHIDLGHLLLVESESINSPISLINYSFYKRREDLDSALILNKQKIQIVLGRNNIPFGSSQSPQLNDYADNIDTISFLQSIKKYD